MIKEKIEKEKFYFIKLFLLLVFWLNLENFQQISIYLPKHLMNLE